MFLLVVLVWLLLVWFLYSVFCVLMFSFWLVGWLIGWLFFLGAFLCLIACLFISMFVVCMFFVYFCSFIFSSLSAAQPFGNHVDFYVG